MLIKCSISKTKDMTIYDDRGYGKDITVPDIGILRKIILNTDQVAFIRKYTNSIYKNGRVVSVDESPIDIYAAFIGNDELYIVDSYGQIESFYGSIE